MKALIEIPTNEPFAGVRVIDLDITPQVGHFVGDQNGNLYRIVKIIHQITRNETAGYPFLKLELEKHA